MTIDLAKVRAKFAMTPEEQEAQRIEDERRSAHHAESSAWETKCYNEKIGVKEFNDGRDAIDRKYGFRPTSEVLAESES